MTWDNLMHFCRSPNLMSGVGDTNLLIHVYNLFNVKSPTIIHRLTADNSFCQSYFTDASITRPRRQFKNRKSFYIIRYLKRYMINRPASNRLSPTKLVSCFQTRTSSTIKSCESDSILNKWDHLGTNLRPCLFYRWRVCRLPSCTASRSFSDYLNCIIP